jgi:hypothetical protein
MPAAANASELPNPVGYFGASFSINIKDPVIPEHQISACRYGS